MALTLQGIKNPFRRSFVSKSLLNSTWTSINFHNCHCVDKIKIRTNLFVSNSFILLNVYCPNLTSLVAGRHPSYLSAGMSTRCASKLLKQSLVTMISAPFFSMSLTQRSSCLRPRIYKLDWPISNVNLLKLCNVSVN